jgi:hypothetical protein
MDALRNGKNAVVTQYRSEVPAIRMNQYPERMPEALTSLDPDRDLS